MEENEKVDKFDGETNVLDVENFVGELGEFTFRLLKIYLNYHVYK